MILTLLVALGAAGLGRGAFGRWTVEQDPAARLGLHGILGLGLLGWITLPIGLLPGGLKWGVAVVGFLALAGLGLFFRERPKGSMPKGPAALALLALGVGALVALVGVLAPSDAYDWDSLAYHLAVPKIWLAAGRIEFVSYIHHSNFPFLIDNLYVWGESWGGQAGAKAFELAYSIYGAFAVFGLARARYGPAAGWWSALAFGTVPMVLWESGTAYVDVAHALFGGLGIWLAAGLVEAPSSLPHGDALPSFASPERERNKEGVGGGVDDTKITPPWILPALLLGGAVASKYTALQTLPILVLVLLAFTFAKSRGESALRPLPFTLVKMGLVALAIGSPWYVRNVVDTGNPVYPFFYSKFGGRNWDAFQERIYKDQQQTFGAGRPLAADYIAGPLEPARLGASVLGTAYMPGRFTDPAPNGPAPGQGFPFASLGAIPAVALLAWLLSGRVRRTEGAVLAVALVSFGAWFVLSQQARYAFVWCLPLTVLAGGAVSRLRAGPVIAGAIVVQAALSLFVQTRFGDAFADKLRVVLGTETAESYQLRKIGFAEPAKFLNDPSTGVKRVALYDEVFGDLLDVPYFWAGPGHTTELGYATMRNGDELVEALKRQGISHVYFDLGTAFGHNPDLTNRWVQAAGLGGAPRPFTGAERETQMGDERNAYKVFLAEAIASGKLRPVQSFGRGGLRQVFAVE